MLDMGFKIHGIWAAITLAGIGEESKVQDVCQTTMSNAMLLIY
jgi:hypothetical protein